MERSCRARTRSPGADEHPYSRSGERPSRRRGSSCGGGKRLGPSVSISLRGHLVAVVATGAVAPIAPIATLTTGAIALATAHHRRRAILKLVDADGHETDDVFVDVELALELGDDVGRGVDFEHHIMRLAVLRDAISQAAQAPGFGLYDL